MFYEVCKFQRKRVERDFVFSVICRVLMYKFKPFFGYALIKMGFRNLNGNRDSLV